MKRKKFALIMLIFLLISITGCFNGKQTSKDYQSNDTKESQYGMNDGNTGDKNEIILSSGTFPGDLRVVGVLDPKNFYCCDEDNKSIYLYNTEKKTKSIVVSAVSPENYIKAVSVNDKWVVWAEDSVKVEGVGKSDLNWSAYSKNLKTGEITEFDKDNGIKVESEAVSGKVEPYEFSVSGDKVVYETYDKLKNITCSVIKMYYLSKKSMEIIDSNKNYVNKFYSHPKMNGNSVTWSLSERDEFDSAEMGSTYVYNVNSKQKQLITTGTDIVSPYIFKNFIAARLKPNGQNNKSGIVLYDLNKKDGWHTVVSPRSDIYKDQTNVEILLSFIDGSYLAWQDNINKNIAVYNCYNKKLYNITQKVSGDGNLIGCIGIYNKVLFWYETGGKNTIQKYAELK